jgi:predicted CoA-binding protein
VQVDYRQNLVEDEQGIRELLKRTHRVAVLGIKTEAQSGKAAFYVPQYLVSVGLEIIPVPVYYPEVTEILGKKVFRKVADVPGDVDLVDVFRKPKDIDAHVDDILAKHPYAVWFQLGIRNDAAAEKLARASIRVVQNRCLMVDYRRYVA